MEKANDISQEEYNSWETSKNIKSTPDPNNSFVKKANSISIVDYARKNALHIVKEDINQAIIEDPATKENIIIDKKSNSWTGKNLDGEDEKGKLVRFYLKVNRIYPQSQEEFISKINRLALEEADKYKTNEEYNKEYTELKGNIKEPSSLEQRERKGKHAETVLANSISIMDVAKKKDYVILSEDDTIAKIKDPLTDGEITVRKDTNKWYAKNPDGKWTNGKTIRFIARMEEMEVLAASDYLLENRAKYITNDEYNAKYNGALDPQETMDNIEVSQESTTVENEKVTRAEKSSIEKNDNRQFSKEQLAEIISGVRKGIDVKAYSKLELHPEQMREIRLGLEKGINLSEYAFKNVPAKYLKEVRLAVKDGLDIEFLKLDNQQCIYSAEQAREIRLGLKNGLNAEQIRIYADRKLSHEIMKELRLGVQSGFEVMKDFNTGHFKSVDIHTIRMNLEVRKLIELLREKLSMAFEFVCTAFSAAVGKQIPGVAKDVKSEAEMEVRDIVKDIVENMEELVADQTEEMKYEIYKQAFSQVVESGTSFSQIMQEPITESVIKTTESFVSTLHQSELKKSSLESLMNEYIEQFSKIVNEENVKIAEFSQKLFDEPNLNNEQKKALLLGTFESEFGKSVAKKIVEFLPESEEHNVQSVQEEIIEDFSLEQ